MTSENTPKFVVLAILDGWGIAPEGAGNAITQAQTPNISKFRLQYPQTQLDASGKYVGLPEGEDGNTETGHLNLGAGRIVYQDIERINIAIQDGSFFKNKTLLSAIDHVKKNSSSLHLMGLIGAGAVHSKLEHLFALIHLCADNKIKKVYIHLFTDGRDSPPMTAKTYLASLKDVLKREGVGEIASIMGRYWAMDRDQRWDRIEKAYLALTSGKGNLVKTPEEAVDASYADGKTDEFIEPSLVYDSEGKIVAQIKEGDAVIFFNFRIDRPRQLSKTFVLDDFSKANISFGLESFSQIAGVPFIGKKVVEKEPFNRGPKIKNLLFVTMTDYGKILNDDGARPAFPPEIIDIPISGVISNSSYKQLKITESEKERFVTFYFNGLREKPYDLEDRIIIASSKVSTYDQKPEMSGSQITEMLIAKIQAESYKFIVVNYPNADMVGHTGNIGPTVKAVEFIDENLGKIYSAISAFQGALVITADHGNAEEMINQVSGEIDTEHSTNKVPFIVVYDKFLGKPQVLPSGRLADVAPSILALLDLPIPSSMTGRNLLEETLKNT